MKIRSMISAASLCAVAGMALAQPTTDGVFNPATEGAFYGDIIWFNNVPTGFGDNQAGDFTGGNFGLPPENVTTGIEVAIPLSALGGATSFRLAGWVNSGDRSFISNQLIHSGLPIDTNNIGNSPNFNNIANNQWAAISAVAVAPGSITVNGSRDAAYGAAQFLQSNYTGFGDSVAGTPIGGGGSEIDAVYAATDGTNLYLFIAGNLEANGNALDLYFDLDSNGGTGLNSLGGGSGPGGFIMGNQSGLTFDTGFGADFLVSVDSTSQQPRLWAGSTNGSIDEIGTIAGYGAANAGVLGSYRLAVDNSNTEGVIGSPASPSPIAPDADWAYGSELNNVRAYIDTVGNRLHVFIAGNMQANYNKLQLFFDTQPGGQNVIRNDNVDISFNGLNSNAGVRFDEGFEANYWLNINNGVDGGTNQLVRFTDAAVLRTNGANLDPFFGVITDYGAYSGGLAASNPVINFSGPRVDIQDGSLGSLFTEYAPRLTAANPLAPIPQLVRVAINNSNVGGVTSTTADPAAVRAVNTGIEISIDLDEIGWDGQQDILMAGWISSAGFDFLSNQVIGGLPDGSANIGSRDTNGDGVNDLDFNQIAGTQFINLSAPPVQPCVADFNGDGFVNFFDISAFIAAFNAQNPAADLAPPFGVFNFFDISTFIAAYNAGCP